MIGMLNISAPNTITPDFWGMVIWGIRQGELLIIKYPIHLIRLRFTSGAKLKLIPVLLLIGGLRPCCGMNFVIIGLTRSIIILPIKEPSINV